MVILYIPSILSIFNTLLPTDSLMSSDQNQLLELATKLSRKEGSDLLVGYVIQRLSQHVHKLANK